MKRLALLGVALLFLGLCAVPVLAATPDPAVDALAAIFAPAADSGATPPAADAATRIVPKSTCVATCGDGSTVTCSGTTCSATNSACPGTRGSCTGSTSGTINCPVCSTFCRITATCQPSGSVSCTSNNNDCLQLANCYAECDGIVHWCPQHKGSCPII